jgi:hypothetical protein
MTGRRRASALSWRGFPVDHRHLQRSRPNVDPAVPFSLPHAREVQVPPPLPPQSRIVSSSIWPRNNISDGPIGRSWRRYCTEFFDSKALCTWLSQQLMIHRIALSALLAPCRAKHGTDTGFPAPTTWRWGDADGPASAPPFGAAAAARPAGDGLRYGCHRAPLLRGHD